MYKILVHFHSRYEFATNDASSYSGESLPVQPRAHGCAQICWRMCMLLLLFCCLPLALIGQGALTSPTPGSVLAGSSATFTWTPATGATEYQLWLGTTGLGSSNLYDSGSTTATSETVTVPANGVTVFARLYQLINGTWRSSDYTYTESGTLAPPALTSPQPGSTLTGSSVTFTWTAGSGPAQYALWLGTTGVGSSNLYYSGSTKATTVTVSDLPTNGVTVYARLWWEIDGSWRSADYTYTAYTAP